LGTAADTAQPAVSNSAHRLQEWFEASLARRFRALGVQHPLLLRRLRTAALVVTLLVAGRFTFESLRQWVSLGHYPLGLDFSLYRASAIQGMEFGWNHLYDVTAQRQVYDDQVRANPSLGAMVWAPNVYPPPVSWLGVPFTFLPIPVGYLIWSFLIFSSTAFAFLILAPGNLLARAAQLALALSPFLVLFSLAEGQVTSFVMAAVAASWLALKRGWDGWAGMALLPLALKPQTVALVPLALLVAGRSRAFVFWLIATAALGLAVLANIGFDGAIAYLNRLQYASSHPGEYLLGGVYTLTLHMQTRAGRYAVEILTVSLALWVAWRHRRAGPEVPIAAGLIGSLMFATYLHVNDMITLFPAGFLILRAHPMWFVWFLLAGGYVVTLLCTGDATIRWGEGLVLFEITVLVVLAVIEPMRPSQAAPWIPAANHLLATTGGEPHPTTAAPAGG
jgi:hypothetical protein